jgi:hypothetical protein
MSIDFSSLHNDIILLSKPIQELLSKAQYKSPEGSNISIKSMLQSLLSNESESNCRVKDFVSCCAALASSAGATHDQLSWIPSSLSLAAISAFQSLSDSFSDSDFFIQLLPHILPLLKDRIRESSTDKTDGGDQISAATARVPVALAVVAAYQFRWLVTQVNYPHLGKLCSLVRPCALTALDHWSPEVKGQGMISVIHLVKNVKLAELDWCKDVLLDACLQNIIASDEIWQYSVEMSVLLLTSTQQNNPRSIWYEKSMNEMLSHLERQPKDKERRIIWLKHIDPIFNALGLVLLAHFRRLFPLFFKWLHADDDQTVLLVLDRVETVIKSTWIRNSPHTERFVNELVILYKEAALKVGREDIRARIIRILNLFHGCKGQFEATWNKYKDDPDLTTLVANVKTMYC